MKIGYKEDIDKIVGPGCATEGCDCTGKMFLHASCCLGKEDYQGVEASYDKGNLTIACRKCKKLVVILKVASKVGIVIVSEVKDV